MTMKVLAYLDKAGGEILFGCVSTKSGLSQ